MTRVVAVGVLVGARTLLAQVPGELIGRVTDASTARPVVNAFVDIAPRGDVAHVNADGVFALRGLEPRLYRLRVRALGYRTRELDVTVANGRQTIADVALERVSASLAAVLVQAARDTQAMRAIVIDRVQLEQSGRRDLGELLRTFPGVVVTQAGGSGSESRVSIRGSGAHEVLVLVDGVPANSPVSGIADLSLISLENIERITVRPGAQSARYGARAMAGVIEVETRHAVRDASAVLRSGAFGERNVASSIGAARDIGTERGSASLTADYRTVRGNFQYDVPQVRGGGRAVRENAGATSRWLLGSSTLSDASGSIGVRGSWQAQSRGLVGSVVQPSLSGRQRQGAWQGALDVRWHRGGMSFNSTADAVSERSNYADASPPFGQPFDDTVHANSAGLNASGNYDQHNLSATFGGEWRELRVTSTSLSATAPRRQRVLGAYSNLHVGIPLAGDRVRADVEAGARVDEQGFSRGAIVSPRLALRLTQAHVAASASIASGYAPPTLSDQFFREGVETRPNPSLRAERTRGDVEGRVALREASIGPVRVSAEGAAFRANLDGMILWTPNFQFIWSPGNFDVHRSGWDVQARTAVPQVWLETSGSLSRANVVYAGSVLHGQVPYRPRTTAAASIAITPPHARLELINAFVGARRTVAGSSLNVLPAYWRTDVKASVSRSSRTWKYDAGFSVDNVLDRPAAMLVDYPFPGRGWSVSLRIGRAESAP